MPTPAAKAAGTPEHAATAPRATPARFWAKTCRPPLDHADVPPYRRTAVRTGPGPGRAAWRGARAGGHRRELQRRLDRQVPDRHRRLVGLVRLRHGRVQLRGQAGDAGRAPADA